MASFLNMPKTTLILNLIITIFCITLCCNTYSSLASPQSLLNHKQSANHNIIKRLSTIAAEPSVLPYTSPLSSPTTSYALSPDISPLFPTTPKSSSNAPSSDSSSLPIIPASPSPPNPDDSLSSPHPEFSMSPTGSMPESAAFGLNACVLLHSAMVVLVTILFW